MQIRERGGRMQLIRYTGFNREKKRADTALIGSFPRSAIDMSEVPAELVSKLEPAELAQLEVYFQEKKNYRTKILSMVVVRDLPENLAKAEAAIAAGEVVEDPDQLFFAMRSLAAALVKAGHKRPAFSEKAPKKEKPHARQLPLVQ